MCVCYFGTYFNKILLTYKESEDCEETPPNANQTTFVLQSKQQNETLHQVKKL